MINQSAPAAPPEVQAAAQAEAAPPESEAAPPESEAEAKAKAAAQAEFDAAHVLASLGTKPIPGAGILHVFLHRVGKPDEDRLRVADGAFQALHARGYLGGEGAVMMFTLLVEKGVFGATFVTHSTFKKVAPIYYSVEDLQKLLLDMLTIDRSQDQSHMAIKYIARDDPVAIIFTVNGPLHLSAAVPPGKPPVQAADYGFSLCDL